jgi:hypothetical protein
MAQNIMASDDTEVFLAQVDGSLGDDFPDDDLGDDAQRDDLD